MAAPTFAGPLNQLPIALPGGNQVAYNVGSGAGTIKSSPGIAVRLNALGAGGITMWDASVSNTTTFTVTSNNSTSSGTVTNGYLSITNQFYANSSVAGGSTVNLNNPCAAGIAYSVSGAAATFVVGFA